MSTLRKKLKVTFLDKTARHQIKLRKFFEVNKKKIGGLLKLTYSFLKICRKKTFTILPCYGKPVNA